MPGAIRNDPSLFNKPLIANTVCEFRARINRVRSNDAFSVSCNQSSFDSNDITIQLFFVLFSFSLSIYIYSRVLYMFRIFEEFYLPFESLSYRRQSPRRRKNNRCYDISETERKKNDAAVHFAVYMCALQKLLCDTYILWSFAILSQLKYLSAVLCEKIKADLTVIQPFFPLTVPLPNRPYVHPTVLRIPLYVYTYTQSPLLQSWNVTRNHSQPPKITPRLPSDDKILSIRVKKRNACRNLSSSPGKISTLHPQCGSFLLPLVFSLYIYIIRGVEFSLSSSTSVVNPFQPACLSAILPSSCPTARCLAA